MIKNVYRLHVKYPLFLSDFNEILIFSKVFRILKDKNFMEIRLVGVELIHAGGQKDRYDEANSRFSQFCERVYKMYRLSNGKATVL